MFLLGGNQENIQLDSYIFDTISLYLLKPLLDFHMKETRKYYRLEYKMKKSLTLSSFQLLTTTTTKCVCVYNVQFIHDHLASTIRG